MTFIIVLFSILFQTPELENQQHLLSVPQDSIEGNMIIRTEDLFRQAGINLITLDRMSLKTHNRYYGFYGPQPTFFLDEIPFDTDFFGLIYPQHFPVENAQIGSTNIYSGIGQKGGTPYSTGSYHLKSAPVKKGLSFFYSGQIGHNSGEPGPWVYDPDKVTPNIERFGPWINGSVSYSADTWYAKGLVRYHNFFNRDPFVQTRFRNMRMIPETNEVLEVDSNTLLGMFEAGVEFNQLEIRTRFIRSDSNEFLFFQPLGREVPTVLYRDQYSLNTTYHLDDKTAIKLNYHYSETETEERRNRFDHQFNWNQQKQNLILFFTFNERLDSGVQLERFHINTQTITARSEYIPSVFLSNHFNPHSRTNFSSYTRLSYHGGSVYADLSGTLFRSFSDRYSSLLSIFYSKLAPIISNPTDYWTSKGYSLYQQLGIPYSETGQISPNKTFGLSVEQILKLSDPWIIHFDLALIRHQAFNIPNQPVLFDSEFNTMPGIYSLQTGQQGIRADAIIKVEYSPSTNSSHTLSANLNRTLDGDPAYVRYWENVPGLLVQYDFVSKSFPDLMINPSLGFQTSTTWHEFEALDGEQTRSFHTQYPTAYYDLRSTLPAHLSADLNIAKWFWQQRVRGALQLRNLFNAGFQSHPLAIREGFGFMVRIEIRL